MKSLLNILQKTELPKTVKPDSKVIELLNHIGLDKHIIKMLSNCSFVDDIVINDNICFNQFNAMKAENLNKYNRQCIKNGFLIIGSNFFGDPIVVSLRNLCVGYANRFKLWSREKQPIEKIIFMTDHNICEFFLKAFDN